MEVALIKDLVSELPPLSPGCVHVWQIPLQTASNGQLCYFYSSLDSYEKTLVHTFISPLVQNNFIISHAIMRKILAVYTNRLPEQLTYWFNSYGKPYLTNALLQFNLSHAGDKALLAVTIEQEVGIDIEHICKNIDDLKIAEQIFSISERKYLQTLNKAQRIIAFYHGWSRKEAVIKALGQGLSYLLQDFTVNLQSKQAGQCMEIIGHKLSQYKLYALPEVENYATALAVKGALNQICYFDYKLNYI